MFCKNLNGNKDFLTCRAFPNGIPFGIIANNLDHRDFLPGDNGIKFSPKNKDGQDYADKLFGNDRYTVSQKSFITELLDLTEQILILRGGPTSGNWAHSGRPGKKGGSGRGGGFRRIKVKPGASRKKVKQERNREKLYQSFNGQDD
jgi:hypothetical protein